MTRNGKIARLPRRLRDELNTRLDDGEQAKDLIQWLNQLDEVQKILSGDFAGRPINEQNLSEWKQGGFLDWQRRQEARDGVRRLIEHSDDIEDAAEDENISDRLASILAAELAERARMLLQETTDPKQQWQYLRQALRQLHLLRKADQRAERARMDAARWEHEMARWQLDREQREEEKKKQEMSDAFDEVMAPLRAALKRPALVLGYGGGEAGEKAADFVLEMERLYRWPKFPPPEIPHHPQPAQPPPIKLNQTESR